MVHLRAFCKTACCQGSEESAGEVCELRHGLRHFQYFKPWNGLFTVRYGKESLIAKTRDSLKYSNIYIYMYLFIYLFFIFYFLFFFIFYFLFYFILFLFYFIFCVFCCDPTRVMPSSFLSFLDHTQRCTTVDMTPLDE
jgi:hypothetical protein